MRAAFSLVELSIVLVILGLLVGGILAGQSLIRASELRAVGTEYQRYLTATHAFRDKYMALPGDFSNATRFWGLQVVGSGCTSRAGIATASSPGACDGNADNAVTAGAAGEAGEGMQYWRHMALAGLIEGTYSGLAGAGHASHCVVGSDCPASRISRAGWGLRHLPTFAGNGTDWAGQYGHFYDYGANTANSYPSGNVMTPAEAWNIDTKLDDGMPGLGKMLGYSPTVCGEATGPTDFAANYRLSSNDTACRLHFLRVF